MKHKELFWMIVPCLLLLCAGAYFAQRANEPFHVVIDEAKVVPVTARDIAEGYDTRVWLRAYYSGRRFKETDQRYARRMTWNDQVFSSRTGKEVQWPHGIAGTNSNSFGISNGDERMLRYKLNKLSPTAGGVELRLSVSAELQRTDSNEWKTLEKTPSITYKIPLRAAGASIALPPADKSLPFELLGFRSTWGAVRGGQQVDLNIVTHRLEPPDPTYGHTVVALCDPKLLIDGASPIPFGGCSYGYDEHTAITEITPDTLQTIVPNSARNVVFKAELSRCQFQSCFAKTAKISHASKR